MQGCRTRNSAVERAISAQPGTAQSAGEADSVEEPAPSGRFETSSSSDAETLASAPRDGYRGVPQLPEQCSRCMRWVDPRRRAIMPIGASPWCALCHAWDQVGGAIKEASLTEEKESEVLEVLYHSFELLRGR